MIIYVLLAFGWAKIRGYRIRPIFKAYALYPFALVELLYWSLQVMIFTGNYTFVPYSSYIKSAFLYALILPMLVYKLYKPGLVGAACILTGTALNRFVMHQNGGKMPVFPTLSKLTGYYSDMGIPPTDSIHVLGDQTTKFKWLADYIDVGYSIVSPGDVLIHLFTFIIVYYSIKEINRRLKEKSGG